MTIERNPGLSEGTVIVATYGLDEKTNQPFRFLYEFGYYTQEGAVVYIQDARNMQDSCAFTLDELTLATKDDLENLSWGN